jgi:glycosyltransferase involved in cell wall biosynthesis
VIHNGVAANPSSDRRCGRAQSLRVRPGQKTIVVAGPVCPRKGQADVLPALVGVVARRTDVDVLFVGRSWGQPHDPVLTAARRHGPRIRHVEHIPRLAEVLGDASLVVVPSRSEGFGRIAVEAMAAGVPVLARRVEGLLEALEGHADPWLPELRERWADRIIAELDRPRHTPDELRALATRFSPAAFCDGVLEAYTKLLRRHR